MPLFACKTPRCLVVSPQLRQIQLQIKSEEDSLRDHQRATIKARAEALAAGRAAEAEARNTAKDEYGERRKQVC